MLLAFAVPLVVLKAADDAELRQQRMAAQKERQDRKNERSTEINNATRQFREFVRDLKAETREEARDLDTEFQLRRVELNADHQTRMAEVNAEYQTALSSAYAGATGDSGENTAQYIQEKLTERMTRQFELEKQSAEELHQAKIGIEERKHELWAGYDRRAIEEAESLGLTGDYEPILARPIGGELTNQEEQWNAREPKDIEKLKQRNEMLLSEFRTGGALRAWELANLQEDFDLTWQEKSELREVEAQTPLPNLLAMPGAETGPEAQQNLMAKLAELEKEKRLIKIKYDQMQNKETIMRREERKEILAGE